MQAGRSAPSPKGRADFLDNEIAPVRRRAPNHAVGKGISYLGIAFAYIGAAPRKVDEAPGLESFVSPTSEGNLPGASAAFSAEEEARLVPRSSNEHTQRPFGTFLV